MPGNFIVTSGCLERESEMKKTRPEWMKEPLRNKKVDEILCTITEWVTDGAVQSIYEYIRELERGK